MSFSHESNKFIVKEMSSDDVNAVYEINKQCFTSETWSVKSISEQLDKQICPFAYSSVAIDCADNKICGFINTSVIPPEANIYSIAVLPEYRKNGVGDMLLTDFISVCKNNDTAVDEIWLEVRVSNTAAIRLYQKHGFEITGKRKNFYTCPDEDAYLMRLCLN